MDPTVRQLLIQRAVTHFGLDEVARKLSVPKTTVQAWLDGKAQVPDASLRALIDVMEKS